MEETKEAKDVDLSPVPLQETPSTAKTPSSTCSRVAMKSEQTSDDSSFYMNYKKNEDWMRPPIIYNCPVDGLECLAVLDELHIEPKTIRSATTTETDLFEYKKALKVTNSTHQKIYMALEEFKGNEAGVSNPFQINIVDRKDKVIIHLEKEPNRHIFCFKRGASVLKVESPPGTELGTVELTSSLGKPKYKIKNVTGRVELRIEGDKISVLSGKAIDFKIIQGRDRVIGSITNEKSEEFSANSSSEDAQHFKVSFPLCLHVVLKALVFAATFSIVSQVTKM